MQIPVVTVFCGAGGAMVGSRRHAVVYLPGANDQATCGALWDESQRPRLAARGVAKAENHHAVAGSGLVAHEKVAEAAVVDDLVHNRMNRG